MRRTKEEAKKTRGSILDAAVKKFAEKGVAATTLSEIAEEANVTRGAIYWHFKDKLDIFDALHARVYKPLSDLLEQEIEKEHPDPLQRLQEICKYLLSNIEEDKHLKYSLSLFWVECDYNKEWLPFREKHYYRKNESIELLSYFAQMASEKGMLADGVDARILSLSLFCFLRGIVIAHIRQPELFDLQKEGFLMIDQFFQGIKT